AHERVGGMMTAQVGGVKVQVVTLPTGGNTHVPQDLFADEHIGEVRNVLQHHGLVGEQGGQHEVQGGVLGAVHRQFAGQRCASVDEQDVVVVVHLGSLWNPGGSGALLRGYRQNLP